MKKFIVIVMTMLLVAALMQSCVKETIKPIEEPSPYPPRWATDTTKPKL